MKNKKNEDADVSIAEAIANMSLEQLAENMVKGVRPVTPAMQSAYELPEATVLSSN